MRYKLTFLLLLSLIISTSIFATHTYGGYVSYQHLRGTTYGVSVVLFQDANSPAIQRNEIAIDWGDGSEQDTIRLTYQSTVDSSDYILKRTFIGNHTYSTAGTYTISVEDPNRVVNIINIPNSVNEPIYLSSTISIAPFSGNINDSAIPTSSLFLTAKAGEKASFNLASFDKDNDFLTYHLVSAKGVDGNNITNYTIPTGIDVDFFSGEFNWENPTMQGKYVFSVEITECRNDVFVAKTTIDFVVEVVANNAGLELIPLSLVDTSKEGNIVYSVGINDSVEVLLLMKDSSLSTNASVSLYEETTKAELTKRPLPNGDNEYTFKWKSDSTNLRCSPYLFVFRASDGVLEKDLSILVSVEDSLKLNCDTLCGYDVISLPELSKTKMGYKVFPNPSNSAINFNLEGDLTEQVILQLYNITGTLVLEEVIKTPNAFTIPRGNLKSGTYFYQIISTKGNISTGKLMFN